MLQGTKNLIILGVLGILLVMPAQALAQSSVTSDGYSDSSITVVGDAEGSDEACDPGDPASSGSGSSSDPDCVTEASSATLPFSGLDAGLLLATGGALVLLGFGMRRLTRRPDPA